MTRNQVVVILDGMSIVFRCFYAIQYMYNGDSHIGGIYGFVNQLLNLINRYNTKYIVVALDTKEKTWRHLQYAGYKANRKKAPPELIPQFQLVRDACNAFGIRFYEGGGCEADDWIASCAHQYSPHTKVYVVSTDKDLLQLVSKNVSVYDPFKQIEFNAEQVMAKWGVKPCQIVDLLVLSGDAVDGIVGIPGIGPKTAAKWLNEYGTLDNILLNIPKLDPKSRRDRLLEGIHTLAQMRELILLRNSLTVNVLEEIKMNPCGIKIKDFLHNNGLTLFDKADMVLKLC